jgi:hypothetical protein
MADADLDPTLSSQLARSTRKLSHFSHKWSMTEAVLAVVHHVAVHSLCLPIGKLAEGAELGVAFTKDEARFLSTAQLHPEGLKSIHGLIKKCGTAAGGLKLWNLENWTDPVAQQDAISAVNQMLNQCVLNPRFETPRFGRIDAMRPSNGACFPRRRNWRTGTTRALHESSSWWVSAAFSGRPGGKWCDQAAPWQ